MTQVATLTEQQTSVSLITEVIPGVPGFPWESILIGLTVGFLTLIFLRHARRFSLSVSTAG